MPPKSEKSTSSKAKVNLAKDFDVTHDLKRVVDHIKRLNEGGKVVVAPLAPFRKRLELEMQEIKDEVQLDTPNIPLLVTEPITYEALRLVMTGLEGYPWLRQISLLHCSIGDDGAMIIAEYIRQFSPSADRNPFGIEVLELPENDIGPKGAAFLGRLLTQNESLKQLVLDFNPLGDEGAGALGDGLKWNSTLEKLSMQYCHIGPEGGEHIAKYVVRSCSVKDLSLKGNPIGPLGVANIGRSLAKNAYLTTLDLSDTSFGIDLDAIEALRDGIEGNDTLESIDLNHNSMVPVGVQLLLEVLRGKPKITRFVVHDRISSSVFKDILDTVNANIKMMKKKKKKGGKKSAAAAAPPALPPAVPAAPAAAAAPPAEPVAA